MKQETVQPKKEEDWEADSAVDTLIRAEEIKGNKDLMGRVNKRLAKKYSMIKSLQDLKDIAKDMDERDMNGEEEDEEG